MKFIVALIAAVTAEPAGGPSYNGDLKYFIADLGPSFPCHPLYSRTDTWFFADDADEGFLGIRTILDSLAKVGFNAIRLPMWPEADAV